MNEAYRVLGDPARRVVYDRSLAQPVAPVRVPGAAPPVPQVAPTAKFPWRGFTVATVLAICVVAAASLFADPGEPAGPDGLLQPGSCVTIQPNGDARESACTGVDDLVVDVVVPFGTDCPAGTEGHRDHQGQGTACLTP